MSLNKTISRQDLRIVEVDKQARALKRFAWKMFWRREPFAVNGVSRWRWNIRWNKLWEYSRALAYIPWQPDWRVLDFGGGATLPVYYLADEGVEVSSFDIDIKLTEEAKTLATKHAWPLHASARDLTADPIQAEGQFNWVMSFCVLEHLPLEKQLFVTHLLATYLKPGGYMTITFDYGEQAPVEGALHSTQDVERLIRTTGLQLMENQPFLDTGERFGLDKKYPQHQFTFGSLFFKKPILTSP